MSNNALSFVGKKYPGITATGYATEDVIIGAAYLITRDYTDGQIVIAQARRERNNTQVSHDGQGWYSTLVNPAVNVGDKVLPLETVEGGTVRRDRVSTVRSINDDGTIVAKQSMRDPQTLTAWVLRAESQENQKKDKHYAGRRDLVIDRLTKEGMRRLGDTGYATSAREFFDTFKLPRPPVKPVAQIDMERTYAWNEIGYDMRDSINNAGITSLRTMTVTGRAKVHLKESECRCKDITPEEATSAMEAQQGWKVVKVHKVECLWCTEIGRVNEAI